MHLIRHVVLVATSLFSGAVLAAGPCEAEIEANDAMQFSKSTLQVPASCKTFTVALKHTGKLPKAAMGHNWVLSKAADAQGVAADGIAAGLDKDYLKSGDARVIAHTKVIGGGERDAVSLDVGKLAAGETYAFFCSFPGHASIMKGTLRIVP